MDDLLLSEVGDYTLNLTKEEFDVISSSLKFSLQKDNTRLIYLDPDSFQGTMGIIQARAQRTQALLSKLRSVQTI